METQFPQSKVRFSIAYPERLNRLTTFFRLVLIIPILIILALLATPIFETSESYAITFGILFIPTVLMILFRKKYPEWWFNWNLAFMRFQYRIVAYFYLLRDEYPSTGVEQAVHLSIDYPQMNQLNRALPLIKWLLAIPHYIILTILRLVALLLTIITWFVILFTAKYPRPLFNFMVGWMRWSIRVIAYAFLLVTDKYLPFSFKP